MTAHDFKIIGEGLKKKCGHIIKHNTDLTTKNFLSMCKGDLLIQII